MSKIDVVRAWKDENYRANLSDFERSQLPDNPAGLIELSETDLHKVAGGVLDTIITWSWLGCWTITVCPTFDYCPSQVTVCPTNNGG